MGGLKHKKRWNHFNISFQCFNVRVIKFSLVCHLSLPPFLFPFLSPLSFLFFFLSFLLYLFFSPSFPIPFYFLTPFPSLLPFPFTFSFPLPLCLYPLLFSLSFPPFPFPFTLSNNAYFHYSIRLDNVPLYIMWAWKTPCRKCGFVLMFAP